MWTIQSNQEQNEVGKQQKPGHVRSQGLLRNMICIPSATRSNQSNLGSHPHK